MATTLEQILNGNTAGGGGNANNAITNQAAPAAAPTPTPAPQPAAANSGNNAVDADRGIKELNSTQNNSQPQQAVKSADPGANAKHMVEQLRQQQATAEPKQDTSVGSFVKSGGMEVQAPQQAEKPADAKPEKKSLRYQEIFNQYFPEKPLTAEQIKAQQKRRRREAVLSAIGDGISALANIYVTSHYAPNAFDPEQLLSKKNYERWQKLVEDRKTNAEKYYNARMRALQLDNAQAIAQQNADTAAEWKKADTERKNAIAKAQGEVLAARAAKDQSAAYLAAKRLEYLMAGWPEEQAKKQAEIDLLEAKKKQADAQANNANASADEHRRRGTASWVGGKGGSSGKPYATLNGVPYASKADYERAVVSYAKQYGIPLQYKKKGGVGGMTETTTNRTIAALASDVEAHYRKTHAKSKPKAPAKPAKKGGGAKGANYAAGLKL